MYKVFLILFLSVFTLTFFLQGIAFIQDIISEDQAFNFTTYFIFFAIVLTLIEYGFLLKRLNAKIILESSTLQKKIEIFKSKGKVFYSIYSFIVLSFVNLLFFASLLFLISNTLTITTGNIYEAKVLDVKITKSYDTQADRLVTLYAPIVSFNLNDKEIIKDTTLYTETLLEKGDTIDIYYSELTDSFLEISKHFYLIELLHLIMSIAIFYIFVALLSFALTGRILNFIQVHVNFLVKKAFKYIIFISMFAFVFIIFYIVFKYLTSNEYDDIPLLFIIIMSILGIVLSISTIFIFKVIFIYKEDLSLNSNLSYEDEGDNINTDSSVNSLLNDFNATNKESKNSKDNLNNFKSYIDKLDKK